MECTPHKNRFTDSVSDLSTMRVIKDDKKPLWARVAVNIKGEFIR